MRRELLSVCAIAGSLRVVLMLSFTMLSISGKAAGAVTDISAVPIGQDIEWSPLGSSGAGW